MSDFLSWTIGVGRVAGTSIKIHIFLILYAGARLLLSLSGGGAAVLETVAWLGLMLLALAWHELGHALMAAREGVEHEEVRIWPLGNLVPPSTSAAGRSPEAVRVAIAGMAASLAMAIVVAAGLGFAGARMDFNPFSLHGGSPVLANGSPAKALSAVWYAGSFGFINWIIFLANLIPALPMDGGRVLRGVLASRSKDGTIAPYTARVCAIVLGLVGIYTSFYNKPGAVAWVGLAILIWWMVRVEIQMMEDAGFFDDSGVFGYDFSQGYTSLEAGSPKVRPRRESALRRWRRRRSESRRLRREAQEAAEAARMDEILQKIHREGRDALTEEEQRFLVRQSAKLRSKRKQGS